MYDSIGVKEVGGNYRIFCWDDNEILKWFSFMRLRISLVRLKFHLVCIIILGSSMFLVDQK